MKKESPMKKGVKLLDDALLAKGETVKCIIVSSYEEYKLLGGTRNKYDMYAKIKEDAKQNESSYISYIDQSCSGIDIPEEAIKYKKFKAQALWNILSLWFGAPLRIVSYRTFNLDEFNEL